MAKRGRPKKALNDDGRVHTILTPATLIDVSGKKKAWMCPKCKTVWTEDYTDECPLCSAVFDGVATVGEPVKMYTNAYKKMKKAEEDEAKKAKAEAEKEAKKSQPPKKRGRPRKNG